MDSPSSEDEELQRLLKERERLDQLIKQKKRNKRTKNNKTVDSTTGDSLGCPLPQQFVTFQRREGTVVPDAGVSLEQLTYGLYALKLITNKNVSDFEMTSNNAAYGDHDDLGIDVTFKNGYKKRFLFQMKHRHQDQRVTRDMLTQEFFQWKKKQQKSKFYLPSYLKSVADFNVVYILYTNGDTDLEEGCQLTFKKEPSLVVKQRNEMEHKSLLVNTRDAANSVFQFEPPPGSDAKLQDSCEQFYFFTRQHNIETTQQNIKEILSNLFHVDISELFMNFMQQWWSMNFVLTKHLLLVKLTELALSPYIKTISGSRSNEKTEFLKQAIMNFEMTIIEEDPNNVVANIWTEIEEHDNWEIPLQKPSKNGISDIEKTRILWQLGIVPLIVKVDECNKKVVKAVMKLLHKGVMNKRIILIGPVGRSEFDGWDIFGNFLDVVQEHQTQWCTVIMENFNISLQGRQQISLKQFINIDERLAAFVTTTKLLEMSQNQNLLIGQKNVELPEFHIPRTVLKEREIIHESELFEKFDEKLKVICGHPGMGKSRLMQVLNHDCPPESWAAHVNLINYNGLLDKTWNIERITSEFLSLNEDPDVKKIFLEKGKMEIFLDGLDELDRGHLDLIKEWVNVMLAKGASVWISSRNSLRKNLQKNFKVRPVKIEELTREQQKGYIQKRLRNKYDNEKIDKIVTAIFESVDVHNSRHVLGIPLLLHILTETFLRNENVYENLEKENIFVLTKMYRFFFAGKKTFTFEKLGVDERTGNQLGMNFEKHLEQYEIPALRACLDPGMLKELKINVTECDSFLNGIKANGDKYGIIKRVTTRNIPVFDHQTFAEYFASVWLKKNKEKITVDFFLEDNDVWRRMFDCIMVEDHPLHLAFIYDNIDEFRRQINTRINETDEAGRTVLHLACTYGPAGGWHEVTRNNKNYMTMVDMIIDKCSKSDLRKRDGLLNLNVFQYVEKFESLYVMEKILGKFSQVLTDDQKKLIYIQDWYKLAAGLGCVNLLTLALDEDLEILNDIKDVSEPLLHCMIENAIEGIDYVFMVDFLIQHGADLNQVNSEGESPLDIACEFKRLGIIRILVQLGAKCTNGNTILHKLLTYYCDHENILEIVQELGIDIDVKNDDEATAFHFAVMTRCPETVNKLLEMGCTWNTVDYKKQTALHWACKHKKDNTEVINILLNQGMDINAKNIDGQVPLYFACEEGCIENVAFLIEKNADLTIKDSIGRTVLHVTCKQTKRDSSKIINLLLDNNLDINAQTTTGQTPLHIACFHGAIDNVKILKERNADFAVLDNFKNTVLHFASKNKKNTVVMNFVLDQGVDINAQNAKGETALHLACLTHPSNVECLLGRNADSRIKDYSNNTTLHFACNAKHNKFKIVKLVLKDKGDIKVRNDDGKTPLDLAELHGDYYTIYKLFKKF